ncbi:PAS/PAC sensor hybrid histidine kinase [Desulforamulus reducens MI-1]|uniref:Circadian input-output histidine kinase CikA n=1 Tax=Desulforamulus reducens (strain ATCC BAA-1160 / DSM 100696 / MI-1) TaxID=349161 RepID=A4J6F9_DESRM|nr:response regulator [Desulforamulus reducens]ABO50662.1 PAS/PAC sensor hybrid histidine kinase [Desulforamulus reducens MI-1]
MREKLVELLTRREDDIIQRLIDYAKAGGFTRYSSTRRGDWRLSVHEIIHALTYYLKSYDNDQIYVEEQVGEDSVTHFGIESAKLHRARGITLKMFLGLFKYYRRAYLDMVIESNLTNQEKKQAEEAMNTFFDRFEIGFCSEWVGEGPESRLAELQSINRKLTNEKNKLWTIFESMTECVFVVDSNMKITEINAAAAAYFQVNPEEVLGLNCSELMGCECREEDCHLFHAMKSGGCYKDVELEIKTQKGRRRILTSGSFLHDISGKYAGGVQVFADITERNLMEQSLRLHMHANNSSVESVSIFDIGGNLTYANPAAEDLFGMDGSQLLGLGIEQAYQGGEMVLLSLIRGKSWKGEVSQNGKILYIHANPIRLPKGNIIGFYVSARDITAHKATQLKLQQAREETEREAAKLRAIISIMNAAIALVDAEGIITEINEQCLTITGKVREDLIGKKLESLHNGKILEKIQKMIANFRLNRNSSPVTITRRVGGMDVIMNIQPVYRDKTYDGVLLMVVDVTEVAKAKRQAEQALLVAEKASKAKSEFLANMSHEIRTPMNGILGFAEVLIQQELSPQQQESVKIIQQCGEQLMDLINDILDLSKIESGKLVMEETSFSLRKLIHEAVNVIESKFLEQNVEMKIDIEQNLHDQLKGDPTRIRQVLYNLISNAAKFTHQGYVKISVAEESISGADHQIKLRFCIEDTGIGIPKEKLKLIFDAFTQADGSTTRKYGGTGLGLTICKSLTQLMGGEINVESQVNKGSIFSFYIPVNKVEISEEEKLMESEMMQGKNGTVLVVEDDWTTKQLISNYLEKVGYSVITTQQGKQAITLAKIYRPDVMILDILLPDLTGWEILKRIKTYEETKDIPIVVCSVMPEKEQAFSLGAVDFIEKPISEKVLISRLGKLISGKKKDDTHIVLIDDEEATLQFLKKIIENEGYRTHTFARAGDAFYYLMQGGAVHAILLDLLMPGMNGFEFLESLRLKPEFRDIPVIINTAKDLTQKDYQKLNLKCEKILNKSLVHPHDLLEELSEILKGVTGCSKTQGGIERIKILLVEDNHFNQRLVTHMLSDDYSIVEVENGVQALEILEEQKFDLVLMDMQMPVMDGYETTRLIRKQNKYKNLPIIALTAYAMKGDSEKCMAAGCNGYLAKPVKRDQLIKTIKQQFVLSTGTPQKIRIRDKGIESLVPWYLQDIGREMEKLKNAAKICDFNAVRYIGHGLKGSGGAYGFPEFSASGAEIERAALDEDVVLVKMRVNQLRELYTKVLEEELSNTKE